MPMPKIVVNRCFGGYALSPAAYAALALPWGGFGFAFSEDRTNAKLVEVVEQLGPLASAKLEVVEIPDDVEWEITDRDGYERVTIR